MRFFYAIELHSKIKELLSGLQERLKSRAVRGNFTRKENLHLTLRFMGEVQEGHFPVLKKILDMTALRHQAFQLEITRPDVFERGNKSILWCGVQRNEALCRLQEEMEKEIRANGFPAEMKPYKPHITLAREAISDEGIRNLLAEFQPLNQVIKAEYISLMESTRVDGRLTYLCRYRSALKG